MRQTLLASKLCQGINVRPGCLMHPYGTYAHSSIRLISLLIVSRYHCASYILILKNVNSITGVIFCAGPWNQKYFSYIYQVERNIPSENKCKNQIFAQTYVPKRNDLCELELYQGTSSLKNTVTRILRTEILTEFLILLQGTMIILGVNIENLNISAFIYAGTEHVRCHLV